VFHYQDHKQKVEKIKIRIALWIIDTKQIKKNFFNEVGPDLTNNFYRDYKKHLKWFDEIGIETYRTSIQWTRLIDDFNNLTINKKGYVFLFKLF